MVDFNCTATFFRFFFANSKSFKFSVGGINVSDKHFLINCFIDFFIFYFISSLRVSSESDCGIYRLSFLYYRDP